MNNFYTVNENPVTRGYDLFLVKRVKGIDHKVKIDSSSNEYQINNRCKDLNQKIRKKQLSQTNAWGY